MGQYRKNAARANASRVVNLAKDFVGKDGGFVGYSLADGAMDAGDEDCYELSLHAKERVLKFDPGWYQNPVLIPLLSKRCLNLLLFLRESDCATEAGDRLIAALRKVLTRKPQAGPILAITVGYARS
ncbi:hypothetical protein F2S72_08770 [Pseudomonas syringae pv. actinidiae]|nr:hypothetical protein [Pseudomonas syringae pv. actinidiae]